MLTGRQKTRLAIFATGKDWPVLNGRKRKQKNGETAAKGPKRQKHGTFAPPERYVEYILLEVLNTIRYYEAGNAIRMINKILDG